MEEDLLLFKILSIAGALAWLSPLIPYLIKKWITKSKIEIYSGKNIEIGYTLLGPIVNLGLAFTSEKRDALINKIILELVHEKKESHLFEWEWFEESLLEMIVPNHGTVPYKKNQQAIAIKVLNETVVEKKIGFQINEVKKSRKEFIQNLSKVRSNYSSANKDLKDIKATVEYNDVILYNKNAFIWKQGRYSIYLSVFTKDNRKPFLHKLELDLNDLEVKLLEANIVENNRIIDKEFVGEGPEVKEIGIGFRKKN